MAKVKWKVDTFLITGGQKQLDAKFENSFLLKGLLYNPEDKSLAKDVAQKIQDFYFRDKSSNVALFSSAVDVRNYFIFCSYSAKIHMSIKLGLLH
jgi:hypothetical protein